MTELKGQVGVRIRAFRKQRGFTQDDLAEKAGIDPKSLSRIEGGKFNPSLDTLAGLATALGISIGQLFPDSADGIDKRYVLLEAALDGNEEQIDEIAAFIHKLRRRTTRLL